jgi:hypothetical protein
MKPPPISGQRNQPRRLGGLATCAIVAAIGCAAFMLGVQGVSFVRGFRKGYGEARSSRQSDNVTSRLLPFLSRDREDDEEIRDDIIKCIAQLKAIDGAKETWKLEHLPTKVPPAAMPARRKRNRQPARRPLSAPTKQNPDESDLFGETAYIREKPTCPKGGTYIIGKLDEPPRCTFPNHTLDFGHVLVVDESGHGLAGATVKSRNAAGDEQTFTTGTNGLSDNYFSVTFFRKGVRQITASTPGYKSATVPFSANWPAKIVLQKENK